MHCDMCGVRVTIDNVGRRLDEHVECQDCLQRVILFSHTGHEKHLPNAPLLQAINSYRLALVMFWGWKLSMPDAYAAMRERLNELLIEARNRGLEVEVPT